MAIKHIADGADFEFDRSFGFHGSANTSSQPTPQRGGAPPFTGNEPTRGPKHMVEPVDNYAHGGGVHPHHHPHGHQVHHVEHAEGGTIEHHHHGGFTMHHHDGNVTHHHHDGSEVSHMAHGGHAHHMHPHGHHVTHVEHRAHDGAVIHHHEHGGHTVHHADGRVTHHHADGAPVHSHMAHGGGIEHMHDPEGEYVHRARGGDVAEDKAMVAKGIRQHENHEHGGEHTDLHLARGGRAVRLPRGMKPMAERPHSPINTPPRNPNMSTTPRNAMPAGQMGYGVQPSAEPDNAGSDQGIPQLRRGGRAHR